MQCGPVGVEVNSNTIRAAKDLPELDGMEQETTHRATERQVGKTKRARPCVAVLSFQLQEKESTLLNHFLSIISH